MKSKISITQKYYIYFLAVFLFSIVIVSFYSYFVARNSILERTFKQLESIRIEKSNSVHSYYSDKILGVENLANSEIIKNLFDKCLITSDSATIIYIKNLFQFINSDYNKLFILSNKNDILSYDNQIGKSFFLNDSNKILNNINLIKNKLCNLKQSFLQEFVDYSSNTIKIFLVVPIHYNNSANACIILELNNDKLLKMMDNDHQNSGLGNTGESYIVGNDFLMRTTSRFADFSGKLLNVHTTATKNAIKNMIGNDIIKDYRNISVLSSYSPLKIQGLDWIILVEIDKEEALKPIYDLRNSIVILSLVVSIVIFGLVYIGSITITNPIIELKDAAKTISKGDYKIRLKSKTNDELGELISSFNDMAEQLSIQSEQIQKDKLNRISTMIDTLEMERKRLSRDLHDGLGQMLLAVKMKLEQVRNADKSKSDFFLDEALELLIQTINEIRSISNDLTPTVLEMFGLADGLKKLCRDAFNNSEISFQFSCNNLNKINLDSKRQIYIFRIVQELINNILKHSKASEANFEISTEKSMISILVSDNGKGFDTDIAYEGNGIHNILDRVELLKGKVLINSIKNKGTNIFVNLPIESTYEN